MADDARCVVERQSVDVRFQDNQTLCGAPMKYMRSIALGPLLPNALPAGTYAIGGTADSLQGTVINGGFLRLIVGC